jgi:hypothetical protein
MNTINPLALAIVLIMAIAFGICVWCYIRAQRPKCRCGAPRKLLSLERRAQANIYTYTCQANCGSGTWIKEEYLPPLEERCSQN